MTPTVLRKWMEEAKNEACDPDVRRLSDSCNQTIVRSGIKFSDSEISLLRTELSNKPAVHMRSDEIKLCSVLLLDCLLQSKSILVTFESLQSDKNVLLHAWLGGHWECLIVFCDTTVRQKDIEDTSHEVYEFIKRSHSYKQLIILTAFSVEEIKDFFHTEHKFKFEQLSDESQEKVLEKKIIFQGFEVSLKSIL
jgi:hypothetical protein